MRSGVSLLGDRGDTVVEARRPSPAGGPKISGDGGRKSGHNPGRRGINRRGMWGASGDGGALERTKHDGPEQGDSENSFRDGHGHGDASTPSLRGSLLARGFSNRPSGESTSWGFPERLMHLHPRRA